MLGMPTRDSVIENQHLIVTIRLFPNVLALVLLYARPTVPHKYLTPPPFYCPMTELSFLLVKYPMRH
jgi:hypothetical protein